MTERHRIPINYPTFRHVSGVLLKTLFILCLSIENVKIETSATVRCVARRLAAVDTKFRNLFCIRSSPKGPERALEKRRRD